MNNEIEKSEQRYQTQTETENPYLVLGFVEFAIMSTLMIAFFPWSLLYCVVFYGWDETKYIVLALLHDGLKTILALISSIVLLILVISFLVYLFS